MNLLLEVIQKVYVIHLSCKCIAKIILTFHHAVFLFSHHPQYDQLNDFHEERNKERMLHILPMQIEI
jgi:hypothetical protein